MKTYRGHAVNGKDEGGPQIVTVTEHSTGKIGGWTHPLEHRVRHSPTGFQWGYGGSGPADLALSILWDHLDHEPDPWLYQQFKFAHVARWPMGESWTITSDEIQAWIQGRLQEEVPARSAL